MYEWPWTSSQLRRLTKHVREGAELRDDDPSYADVMLWYNNIAVEVSRTIAANDWSPLLGGARVEITSRPKTKDTLRDKLRRHDGMQLKSVQDIAGVRFEADMTLSAQTAVAEKICELFSHPLAAIHDLRSGEHSGYRAVHVWLRLPANVEVQIRTPLQGAWANAYESAADIFGRDIRYGNLPENEKVREMVELMQVASVSHLADAEEGRDALESSVLDPAIRGRAAREHRRMIEESRAKYDEAQTLVRSELLRLRETLDRHRKQGRGDS